MSASDEEVVLITGAAKGIGRAYARGLAAHGYRIAIADLAPAEEVVSELADAGTDALAVEVDVSDRAATERMADEVLDRFGRIDALINNAAYFTDIHKKPFDELTVAEWDRAFAVNVRGTWLCCRAVAPAMKERRYGKIINTSSMTVPTGVPGFLHYVSSKSAIIGLTRALARELGRWNIAVNTVSPDYIPHDEAYAGRQPAGMGEAIREQRCFQRVQQPEDMVGTVLYLVGHGSDFVTGQNLYVNGGRVFS